MVRIGGEQHPRRSRFDHLLHHHPGRLGIAHRSSGLAIDPNAIGHRRTGTIEHPIGNLIAHDVKVGFELAGERVLRRILTQPGGTYRHSIVPVEGLVETLQDLATAFRIDRLEPIREEGRRNAKPGRHRRTRPVHLPKLIHLLARMAVG